MGHRQCLVICDRRVGTKVFYSSTALYFSYCELSLSFPRLTAGTGSELLVTARDRCSGPNRGSLACPTTHGSTLFEGLSPPTLGGARPSRMVARRLPGAKPLPALTRNQVSTASLHFLGAPSSTAAWRLTRPRLRTRWATISPTWRSIRTCCTWPQTTTAALRRRRPCTPLRRHPRGQPRPAEGKSGLISQ